MKWSIRGKTDGHNMGISNCGSVFSPIPRKLPKFGPHASGISWIIHCKKPENRLFFFFFFFLLYRDMWFSQDREATNIMISENMMHCSRSNQPTLYNMSSILNIYSGKMTHTHQCSSSGNPQTSDIKKKKNITYNKRYSNGVLLCPPNWKCPLF